MDSIEGEGRKSAFLLIAFIGFFLSSYSQTIVKGTVKAASTKEPLQSVSVIFKGGRGVVTDDAGNFTLASNQSFNTIITSYVGYKTVSKSIIPNKEQVIDIELEIADAKNTVVVHSKRGKYSNKNNPAVELIRKVIDNKSINKVSNYDYVQFEQYEKIALSLTKKPEKLVNTKLLKNFQFVLENVDTTSLEGKSLLPVYLEEKLARKFYRKKPEKEKTFILGEKKVNYGDYVDQKGISNYLNRLYEDVDIYRNNISLLTNQFLRGCKYF